MRETLLGRRLQGTTSAGYPVRVLAARPSWAGSGQPIGPRLDGATAMVAPRGGGLAASCQGAQQS